MGGVGGVLAWAVWVACLRGLRVNAGSVLTRLGVLRWIMSWILNMPGFKYARVTHDSE